jgi:hypothetical protein
VYGFSFSGKGGQMIDKSCENTKEDSIVIVSGLPRSGTSMMMQMLKAGGLPIVTDNIRKADEDNPKGYYELEKVKNIQEDALWLNDCHGKVLKMVSALLQHLPSNKRYKVIFMERNLKEVLASQKAMLKRLSRSGAAITDEEMAQKFDRHLNQVQGWLSNQKNIDVLYVKFREVIDHKHETAVRVAEFLSAEMDVSKMIQAVEKRLYRQREAKSSQ